MAHDRTTNPAAAALPEGGADPLFERPDLAELSAQQLAPFERLIDGWPESWCDLGRSLYVTLAFGDERLAELLPAPQCAALARNLVLGIAADLGGSQPYINQGADIHRSAMAARVVALLAEQRQNYARVAQLVGMSERHVRRIESRWLRAERARRQLSLSL